MRHKEHAAGIMQLSPNSVLPCPHPPFAPSSFPPFLAADKQQMSLTACTVVQCAWCHLWYECTLAIVGAKRLIPQEWRRHKEFDNIHKLDGVAVITVQLRYNGWITEMQNPEMQHNLQQVRSIWITVRKWLIAVTQQACTCYCSMILYQRLPPTAI